MEKALEEKALEGGLKSGRLDLEVNLDQNLVVNLRGGMLVGNVATLAT